MLGKKTIFEYKSKYSIEESVELLQKVVGSSWNIFSLSQRVCGKVTKEKVRLHRVIPFVGNSFIPFFNGSFQYNHGEVVLSGTYSINIFVKIFMTLWFAFVALGSIQMLIHISEEVKSGKPLSALTPELLMPFALLAFGLLLIALGKWFSRNDISYISSVIEKALGEKS